MGIWDELDKKLDSEKLAKDFAKGGTGSGEYAEVPTGKYEVKIDKLELTKSKAGRPMVSCWFKILSGNFKGQRLFMNQVVELEFQLQIVKKFIEGLDSGINFEFKSYRQFSELLLDVFEAISGAFEYAIDFSQNDKGFSTYKIEEVFEIEE